MLQFFVRWLEIYVLVRNVVERDVCDYGILQGLITGQSDIVEQGDEDALSPSSPLSIEASSTTLSYEKLGEFHLKSSILPKSNGNERAGSLLVETVSKIPPRDHSSSMHKESAGGRGSFAVKKAESSSRAQLEDTFLPFSARDLDTSSLRENTFGIESSLSCSRIDSAGRDILVSDVSNGTIKESRLSASPLLLLVVRRHCESLIDAAISDFECTIDDETVEEFLPQFCQVILGCSEPSFRNKTYFSDEEDEETTSNSTSLTKNTDQYREQEHEQLSLKAQHEESRAVFVDKEAREDDDGEDDDDDKAGPAVIGGRVQPVDDGDSGGYYDRPVYLKLPPAPELDPVTRFYFMVMRCRMEDSLLRRCASNPALAVKLAWLLDDIAASPNSTTVVAKRASRIAFEARHTHSTSTSFDYGIDDDEEMDRKDKEMPGEPDMHGREGSRMEESPEFWFNNERMEQRLLLREASSLIDQLVSVAHEMGHVKKVYNVSRDCLVPEVKARLHWINRHQTFRLAAAVGWVQKPLPRKDKKNDISGDTGGASEDWKEYWRHLDSPSTEEAMTCAAERMTSERTSDDYTEPPLYEGDTSGRAWIQHDAQTRFHLPLPGTQDPRMGDIHEIAVSFRSSDVATEFGALHDHDEVHTEVNSGEAAGLESARSSSDQEDSRLRVGRRGSPVEATMKEGAKEDEELLDLADVEAHLGRECLELVSSKAIPLVVAPLGCRSLRLLRLLPHETVVLNSASRAPFMVMMELLESHVATTTADAFAIVKKEMVGVPAARPSTRLDGVSTRWELNDEPEESFLDEFLRHRIRYEEVSYETWFEYLTQMCLMRSLRGGFGELWGEKVRRLREASPYGKLEGWRLASFMVKSSDDLRREMQAMQFIRLLEQVWHVQEVDVFVRPYAIVCTGVECGLLENIASARSLDSIKKSTTASGLWLSAYFEELFPLPATFYRAQQNFMRSLVPYSIFTWLFQIKDRHNGNILIDTHGHVVHIDFGYMLGESPGGDLRWEKSPFKLTDEFLDVLDGIGSPLWFEFEELMLEAFAALQLHVESIIDLVRTSIPDEFEKKGLDEVLRERIMLDPEDVRDLIRASIDSEHTITYDVLQRQQNGIL